MSEQGNTVESEAVLDAARAMLRTAHRPTSSSATAQVNADALDCLRAAVARVTSPASTHAGDDA